MPPLASVQLLVVFGVAGAPCTVWETLRHAGKDTGDVGPRALPGILEKGRPLAPAPATSAEDKGTRRDAGTGLQAAHGP